MEKNGLNKQHKYRLLTDCNFRRYLSKKLPPLGPPQIVKVTDPSGLNPALTT